MECFRIDWKGSYSLDKVQDIPEAKETGVYAVYRAKKPFYIGKSIELGRRFAEHIRSWSRIMTPRQLKQCSISIGTIYSYEGSRPSPSISAKQLQIVETYLINTLKPKGNSGMTKKGYRGVPIIIINTGKRGIFKKVMSHNPQLLKLLQDNLAKKTKPPNW